ncbi:MAG: phosphatase PAP2/dual specificity phosphatase family protein [Azoarcus sp.]|jgi:hypothetical protein|nr:phosphatase PAP2/dual specificity phosphatase family protein [Azoarcus sp.]
MNSPTAANEAPHWLRGAFGRGVLWLVFLAPLFFLSYGHANQHAADIDADTGVTSFYFAWEHAIPLWPWTIIPYWSIDLLYGFAFLCCRDRMATNRLGMRLLSVQLICITCFFLWPLRFAFVRPPLDGLSGTLFDALTSFDLPYNQAPSLHIALLVIVWRQFVGILPAPPRKEAGEASALAPRAVRILIHAWAILIGVSVLTTWQHHFIDIPTGLPVGLFCLWLWPETGSSPLHRAAARRPALALRYFAGALLALAAALALGGIWLILCWLALALALVAFNYAWAGAAGFQKHGGRQSFAAYWLFAPYTLGAWINARLWTWRRRDPAPVADGVWLGPLPTAREFAAWGARHGGEAALFDLTAELPAPRLPARTAYDGVPCLDLVPVRGGDLAEAVRRLTLLHDGKREVWVACALGYSRSASVVAAWLCAATGKTASIQEAVARLRQTRPQIVLGADSLACLEAFRAGLSRQ